MISAKSTSTSLCSDFCAFECWRAKVPMCVSFHIFNHAFIDFGQMTCSINYGTSAELSEIDQRNRSAKSKSISEIDQRNHGWAQQNWSRRNWSYPGNFSAVWNFSNNFSLPSNINHISKIMRDLNPRLQMMLPKILTRNISNWKPVKLNTLGWRAMIFWLRFPPVFPRFFSFLVPFYCFRNYFVSLA